MCENFQIKKSTFQRKNIFEMEAWKRIRRDLELIKNYKSGDPIPASTSLRSAAKWLDRMIWVAFVAFAAVGFFTGAVLAGSIIFCIVKVLGSISGWGFYASVFASSLVGMHLGDRLHTWLTFDLGVRCLEIATYIGSSSGSSSDSGSHISKGSCPSDHGTGRAPHDGYNMSCDSCSLDGLRLSTFDVSPNVCTTSSFRSIPPSTFVTAIGFVVDSIRAEIKIASSMLAEMSCWRLSLTRCGGNYG